MCFSSISLFFLDLRYETMTVLRISRADLTVEFLRAPFRRPRCFAPSSHLRVLFSPAPLSTSKPNFFSPPYTPPLPLCLQNPMFLFDYRFVCYCHTQPPNWIPELLPQSEKFLSGIVLEAMPTRRESFVFASLSCDREAYVFWKDAAPFRCVDLVSMIRRDDQGVL